MKRDVEANHTKREVNENRTKREEQLVNTVVEIEEMEEEEMEDGAWRKMRCEMLRQREMEGRGTERLPVG
uniref:Uncharacterized protein n=1 Tax=Cucumis melo TaxID=3656 RepID=A0A9I9CJV5_CUCME